jgi:hypothetical protein
MEALLRFMQAQDRNGAWLEWLEEINRSESEFDACYVTDVLSAWYDESGEEKYLNWIKKLANGL